MPPDPKKPTLAQLFYGKDGPAKGTQKPVEEDRRRDWLAQLRIGPEWRKAPWGPQRQGDR